MTRSHLEGSPAEWRIPLGLQMVPSLTLSIGILLCLFSPRWLISQDREDEIEEEMARIRNEVADLRENEIESYRQLLRAPLLHPFLLGIGIQTLQQLTGINATFYYAPEIFSQLSSTYNDSNNSTLFPLLATGIYGI